MEQKKTKQNSLCEMTGGQMRILDMHAHLSCFTEGAAFGEWRAAGEEELRLRKKHGIFTCFSTGTPEEWQKMRQFRGRDEILISFGIHPWYAHLCSFEECESFLRNCDFIGEIGMDSVWCEVPLALQQKRLEQQLEMAADLKKPVLLHTKGQEERIADMVRDFPGKVCVHWYSGPERIFEKFLEQDCYFTLGPDTAALCEAADEAERRGAGGAAAERKGARREGSRPGSVRTRMVREIPANRLFLETDGISAVAWARNEERLELEEIPKVLEENLMYISETKELAKDVLRMRMGRNLREFLGAESDL